MWNCSDADDLSAVGDGRDDLPERRTSAFVSGHDAGQLSAVSVGQDNPSAPRTAAFVSGHDALVHGVLAQVRVDLDFVV